MDNYKLSFVYTQLKVYETDILYIITILENLQEKWYTSKVIGFLDI